MRKLAFAPIAIALLLLAGCGGSSGGDTTGSAAGSVAETAAPTGVVLPAAPLAGPVGKASPVGSWPSFAHDPGHGGGAPVVGPQSAKLLWRRQLEGPVVPGPAVGKGGVVYAASNGGALHAVDLESGTDFWTFEGGGSYGSDLSTVPALLPGGEVLWPGPENTLFALDEEGQELWSEQLPGQPTSPVVTADGNVVVGDTAGTLEQLKLQPKGKPQVEWQVELGDTSFSSPALGKDGTVYTTTEKGLYAVKDGKVLWSFAGDSISEVSPAVAPDGTIILGTNDSEYGISPEGKALWRHKNGTRTYSSPVVTEGGLVYYGDNAGSSPSSSRRTEPSKPTSARASTPASGAPPRSTPNTTSTSAARTATSTATTPPASSSSNTQPAAASIPTGPWPKTGRS